MIGYSIIKLVDLYSTLLLVRILLTWFPNINWGNQPFATLKKIADIYLDPFRKLIPPINMLDFSPIIAFLVLSFIRTLLVYIFSALGI